MKIRILYCIVYYENQELAQRFLKEKTPELENHNKRNHWKIGCRLI